LSFDTAWLERKLEKIDRRLEHNRAKLEQVTREQEESDRAYAILDAEVEKARAELRKLGLLKAE
jgi:exonuclease VII small subunit